jgi:hypothetical protein
MIGSESKSRSGIMMCDPINVPIHVAVELIYHLFLTQQLPGTSFAFASSRLSDDTYAFEKDAGGIA